MRKKAKMIITLKSDLCAGSGYSYAKIIDSDICYDAYGIPYIPARRIKGCLKEAASLIGVKNIEELFGKRGNDGIQGVYIENAYIEDYDAIKKGLHHLWNVSSKGLREDYQKYITPQNVLEQFSSVKAQTKIDENGVAEDGSLRNTRVINQYSPFHQETTEQVEMRFVASMALPSQYQAETTEQVEMRFVAEINFEADENGNIPKDLENSIKALRNMGLNRNRGLGSVKCELEEYPTKPNPDDPQKELIKDEVAAGEEEENCVLEYIIENVSPLMLSTVNDYATERYISGQSVVGFLAGVYVRKHGEEMKREEGQKKFNEWFLENKIIYSALYPYEDTVTYYPAPSYINCLKKTKKMVNMSVMSKIDFDNEKTKIYKQSPYRMDGGNPPKPQRGKFIGIDGTEYKIKEVETELIFHHSRDEEKNQQLYMLEAIKTGQQFRGTIRGKGSILKELKQYLEEETIRFGKSKSAQYGTCKLVSGTLRKVKVEDGQQNCEKGDSILVVLQSDAIFVEEARYTVDFKKVRKQIKEQLGISEKVPETDEEKERETPYSEIEVKELTGYYGKWNLKRQAIPVVAAGSTFEFFLGENWSISSNALPYVGVRRGEGYGLVQVVQNQKIKKDQEITEDLYALDKCITSNEETDSTQEDATSSSSHSNLESVGSVESTSKATTYSPSSLDKKTKSICKEILMKEAKEILKRKAIKVGEDTVCNKWKVSAASLGKVVLMVQEILKNNTDKKDAYESLLKEIEEIKKEGTRNALLDFMKQEVGESYDQFIYLPDENSSNKKKSNESNEILLKLKELYNELEKNNSTITDAFRDELSKCWDTYLLMIFTQIKYIQSEKKGGN